MNKTEEASIFFFSNRWRDNVWKNNIWRKQTLSFT